METITAPINIDKLQAAYDEAVATTDRLQNEEAAALDRLDTREAARLHVLAAASRAGSNFLAALIQLDRFRSAERLEWKRHTVFQPHRVDDGNLIAHLPGGGEPLSFPLDSTLPTERYDSPVVIDPGMGVVPVDAASLDDLHGAVRAWARVFIGRDDIEFPA
ncbi:hypothetical protein [Amycolatopsis thermophila]|uniref:Uncharacterized protein n=1 Tax=Amycolatopsis thermophila TaxID=206084 RepID=A0ABU0ENG3_9PSEU|nr:hypothetical protein [Amycolatopsis thermophila]MDQ0376583.1 hypothetical protein [Amycolatopsis thermophila]